MRSSKIDNSYNNLMDIVDDFLIEVQHRDFQPKELITMIQKDYDISYSGLFGWVRRSVILPLIEMNKIQIVNKGRYRLK